MNDCYVIAIIAAILRSSPNDGGGWSATIEGAVDDAARILWEAKGHVQYGCGELIKPLIEKEDSAA